MPATFELAGAALLIALALAIPAGIVSAVRRNSLLDYVSTVVALLGQSMPTFWLGIMLILLFSVAVPPAALVRPRHASSTWSCRR
jgi:peptide/nickel transport system permease protein